VITDVIRKWLPAKWRDHDNPETLHCYRVFLLTTDGQAVLQHLMDTVYCTVYEGTDPEGPGIANARRSVVHEILKNIQALQEYKPEAIPDLTRYEQELATIGDRNERVV
jgi:hypothetical protein